MLNEFYKSKGLCTGPYGFPMKEETARELDTYLETHSKDNDLQYRRREKANAFECFIEKEHADVSLITDNSVDKAKEVVNHEGLDFKPFQKNPVVTLGHNYRLLPVGRSLWQTKTKSGWKAKTQYIERPENHPGDKEWVPDVIWHMIKNQYLPAKSIGFLPTKWHEPTKEDVEKDFNLKQANIIFDEAMVFEYAVVTIGCNDNAIVEEVAKGILLVGEELKSVLNINIPEEIPEKIIKVKGITLEEYSNRIKNAVTGKLGNLDLEQISKDAIDRLMGKV